MSYNVKRIADKLLEGAVTNVSSNRSMVEAEIPEEDAKLDEVANNIDGLAKLVSKELGAPIKLTAMVEMGRGNSRVKFTSSDLSEKAGVMSNMYSRLVVGDFGGNLTTDNHYWAPVHFSFKYKNGGSNGTAICNAFYSFEKKSWFKR